MTPRAIRKALASWQSWRLKRRVRKRYPGVTVTAAIADECRKKHKPVRDVEKTLREMVHQNLRRELQNDT